SQENLRIADINVLMHAHSQGGAVGNFASLELQIEHTGVSKLSSEGQTYLFRHYTQGTVNPIIWGAVYDAKSDNTFPIKPSEAAESLLRALLELAGRSTASDVLLLYSRPGAWADVVLKKDVTSDNGVDLVIDNLLLEVTYDYVGKRPDRVGLEVQ